jgi:nucleoid-associated protein YgaU
MARRKLTEAARHSGGVAAAARWQGCAKCEQGWNQLYLKATAKSEESRNKIWDAIKKVDPNYSDLKHDIQVDQGQVSVAQAGGAKPSGNTQQGGQKYTVKPGDNLSKISQQFYGDAKKYMTIAKANNLEDPDKIKAGQELIIPAA